MCDCMKEKENLIKNTITGKISSFKGWKIQEVNFKHTLEIFGSGLNIPVILEGLNSKGNEAKKELYYPVIYCPFCGEKYE